VIFFEYISKIIYASYLNDMVARYASLVSPLKRKEVLCKYRKRGSEHIQKAPDTRQVRRLLFWI